MLKKKKRKRAPRLKEYPEGHPFANNPNAFVKVIYVPTPGISVPIQCKPMLQELGEYFKKYPVDGVVFQPSSQDKLALEKFAMRSLIVDAMNTSVNASWLTAYRLGKLQAAQSRAMPPDEAVPIPKAIQNILEAKCTNLLP